MMELKLPSELDLPTVGVAVLLCVVVGLTQFGEQKPNMNDLASRMKSPDPLIPAIFGIIKRFTLVIGSAALGVVLLLPYLLGLAVYGRPPVVPSLSSHANMFYLLLFKLCKERDYLTYKIRLFLYFLQLMFLQPAFGCLWFLDDVLFPGYRSVKIEKPVFIIGDARTGTTQYVQILARDSKNFCAPITLNATLPTIHAWKVGTFIKSFLSPAMVKRGEALAEAIYFSYLPREFQLRHEGGMWEPDTFEVQYNSLRIEFFTQLVDMKRTAHNWWFPQDEQRADFLRFLDAIWKKVAYHRGAPGQHMLIKGHFLKECPELQEMYPDAYFVALAREPEPRLVSQITFLWNGPWAGMAGVPRTVLKDLAEVCTEHLCEYSDSEMAFFDAKPETRISIPFEGYVREIDESVKKTYRLCGIPVPPEVETALAKHVEEHRVWKKARAQHDPDFTLEELGVDTAELSRRHEKYYPRCVLAKASKSKLKK